MANYLYPYREIHPPFSLTQVTTNQSLGDYKYKEPPLSLSFISPNQSSIITMAGFISKAKTLYSRPFPSNSMAVALRHRSSRANKAQAQGQLMEVDTSSSDVEYEVTLKMFDDLIQRILVKKATPDWLPFVPGSSFWVPPRPSPSNVVHLVHKLANAEQSLPPEESLSLASLRGWPSSNFFIEGSESAHGGDTGVDVSTPEGMEGTVKVKVLTFSENIAQTEDEEG